MEFLALLIAIVAFVLVLKLNNRVGKLAGRLAALEAQPLPPAQQVGAAAPEAVIAAPPLAPETAAAAPAITPEVAAATSMAEPAPAMATEAAATLPARPGLEEQLGTRWVVWIGGLTLALGGLFLVRYSIQQGWIGPGVRVGLGMLFALALLAGGEWTRRVERASSIPALAIADIPAILTAAGTAVMFGTVYASYALYGFLAPAAAFVLLGIVALATLAAALLHGPALAGLGVAGAFVTPLLVSSQEPDYWALYVYLAVVAAAAFALARIRLWRWLAVTTIAFALLWLFPCLACGPSMIAPHAFHAVAGFLLAATFVVCGFLLGPRIEPGRIEAVSSGALAAYVFASALIVLGNGHDTSALMVFAVLVAATLAVAFRAEAATAAVGAAAACVAIVFIDWTVRGAPEFLVVPGGALPGIGPRSDAASINAHLVSAALFAILFGSAGFFAQGRSVSAAVPVVWAAAGCFTPLALLVALYARIAHLDRSIPFAALAIVLAGAFGTATEILTRRGYRPGLPISIALFATATLGALALALTFALEKGWLTIALALMCAGTAWISRQRPIPFLRILAALVAIVVVLRIGYEPRIAGDDVGTTPVFNWLLWGYGVPAASFWTAGVLLRRRGDDAPLRVVEAAAILFTVLLAFMEIRHAINHGEVYRPGTGLAETALQVCVWIAMAIGLERLRLRSGSIVHNIAAVVLAAMAAAGIGFGLLSSQWPTFTGDAVGGLVVNWLLVGYALPAVLALLLSYAAAAGRRPAAYGNAIAGVALLLALAYVSLEVRRFYQGPVLTGPTGDAEQYAYSVAWLLFGVILLAAGFVFSSQRARLASALIIALTVLKVFAIDMSVLTGIYRALSFMGLGLVLVTIGWLYQRILFRQQPPAGGAADQLQSP